ncbi:hypothetical protein [Amycolatopsis sp. 195334CR]|uniref:hypothetical protein n=1 Tax=Amycolatopsis sp. 195334CR TaxID=2814588 RepID=UPI001A8F7C2B|nr:hypothetical protein [Amycolatopsis sp. 195334CR]MBN6040390.1 hypothetical protein [Amycolatopsis sp. 195334CR]
MAAREMARRLPVLLRAWGLSGVRVVDELTQHGDRSRAWLVYAHNGSHVAKLTFDATDFVEPGLRIAAALDRAGIRTGAPIPTTTGALCHRIRRWRGEWTLALLQHVDGRPIDWGSPEPCGELLGRVHHILARLGGDLKPAGRLLRRGSHPDRRAPRRRAGPDRLGHTQLGPITGTPSTTPNWPAHPCSSTCTGQSKRPGIPADRPRRSRDQATRIPGAPRAKMP